MYVLPVSIVFISVATIVVALRLFTRIRLLNSPGWDDWCLLFAMVCVPLYPRSSRSFGVDSGGLVGLIDYR